MKKTSPTRRHNAKQLITMTTPATIALPNPLAPIAGNRVDPTTARFLWRAVPDATGYTFQLATDEAFTQLVLTNETTQVRTTLAGLAGDSVYYWRVRATGTGEDSAFSEAAMFRTRRASTGRKTAVPAPLSPVGGIPADASAIAMHWTSVPTASAYHVQVATTPDFSDLAFDLPMGNTTSLTLLSLLPEDNTVYYWRVRCETDKGWQPWSAPVSFHAVPDAKADAFDASLEATRSEATRLNAQWREAHADTLAEAEAPYLTGQTSFAAIVSFALMMVVSFLFLIWVLRLAV